MIGRREQIAGEPIEHWGGLLVIAFEDGSPALPSAPVPKKAGSCAERPERC